MTSFKRYLVILAATITVTWIPTWSPADDTPPAPTAKTLIAVLQSDASTFDKARACQQLAALGDSDAVPALAALLADEKLASHARSALESIGDPSAAAALREALGRVQGKLLAGVVNSLGVRRDVNAIAALRKLAEELGSGVTDEALWALGQITTPEAVDALRQGLTTATATRRAVVAHACLACADGLVTQGKRAEAVALLDQVRRAELPVHLRASAIYAAILARQSGDLSLFVEQLKSEDPALFAVALRAARRLPDSAVTQVLLAELDRLPPARQALVIRALAERQEAEVLAVVQKAATAGPRDVRLAALAALAPWDDASTTALLVNTALTEDADVSMAARESLLQTPARGVATALVARLQQAAPKERIVLLDIIGERGNASAAEAVIRLAGDPADEIRLAALRTLGRLGGPEPLRVLLGNLQTAPNPEEKAVVQDALRAACGNVSEPEACARKLQECMTATPAEQPFLLELLGQVGGGEALRSVAAHARDSRPEIQDAATRVLGGWMSVDAAPVLLELAKTLGDARLQARALRGYLRIARQLDLPLDRRLAMCEEALQCARRKDERQLVAEVAAVVVRGGASDAQKGRAQALITRASPAQATDTQANAHQAVVAKASPKNGPLFDGRTFDGWEGDTEKTFRIDSGAVVGGSLKAPVPRNEFLCTKASYGNFILQMECKLVGPANGGIQFRSQRLPKNHEVSGYQADMSAGVSGGYWGCLYDESRRRKMLAKPDPQVIRKALKSDDWNLYEIRCEGRRIRLSINGVQTVDYTETDDKIPTTGIIGLQIHGGKPSEAWYRNIILEELP